MSDVREQLAEFLHERFAPDYQDHWADLDEFERQESRFWDMAGALLEESPLAARLAADRDTAGVEAKREAIREARGVVTQYLSTAEQWRYDRVCWAFAIMLGEIPEDSPGPPSPAEPGYAAAYPLDARLRAALSGPADEHPADGTGT